jgi:hypothetical protein
VSLAAVCGSGTWTHESPARRLLITLRDADPQPRQPDKTVIEAWLTADDGQTTRTDARWDVLMPAYQDPAANVS